MHSSEHNSTINNTSYQLLLSDHKTWYGAYCKRSNGIVLVMNL